MSDRAGNTKEFDKRWRKGRAIGQGEPRLDAQEPEVTRMARVSLTLRGRQGIADLSCAATPRAIRWWRSRA